MEKLQQLLVDAGLSLPEARTYLALYQLQESQSGRLAETAQVPTSKIYAILESLIDKGLVSYRLQNNIKVFQAGPPEALATLIEKREQELQKQKQQIIEAIMQIKQTKPLDPPQSRYKYYEGTNGIKSLWSEVQEQMHDDTLLIKGGRKESYMPLVGFYTAFHNERVKKKIPARILFPTEDKELSTERKRLPLTQVRFADMETMAEVSVINDILIISHMSKNPHAFLIKDQVFADAFKEMFNKLWEQAKP